jgi:hypothetical protein
MNFNKIGITYVELENSLFKDRQVKGCKFGRDGIYKGEANKKQIEILKLMGCKDINSDDTPAEKTVETDKKGSEYKYKGGR